MGGGEEIDVALLLGVDLPITSLGMMPLFTGCGEIFVMCDSKSKKHYSFQSVCLSSYTRIWGEIQKRRTEWRPEFETHLEVLVPGISLSCW